MINYWIFLKNWLLIYKVSQNGKNGLVRYSFIYIYCAVLRWIYFTILLFDNCFFLAKLLLFSQMSLWYYWKGIQQRVFFARQLPFVFQTFLIITCFFNLILLVNVFTYLDYIWYKGKCVSNGLPPRFLIFKKITNKNSELWCKFYH